MSIKLIKNCIKKLKFSTHAKEEMLYEEYGVIYENEVKESINNGEIIKQYLSDKPYPSFLVFGRTCKGRPLHVVCAPVEEEETIIIITVYQPNPEFWVNYKKRRK